MSLRWTLRPRDALEAGYNMVFRYMCRRVAIFNFEAAAMSHAFATSERLSVAVRVIPRFARRMMIHPGDFVAYAHQSEGGTPQYYVRRGESLPRSVPRRCLAAAHALRRPQSAQSRAGC